MRIVTCFDNNFIELGTRAFRNHSRYASQNGYEYNVFQGRLNSARPAAWDKIIHILTNLENMPQDEWLLWIDADAYFIRRDVRLECFCLPQKQMVVCVDSCGNLNTGVWFVKNTPDAIAILDKIWWSESFIHHQWWENAAFISLYDEFASNIGLVSFEKINTYPQDFNDSTFILHFAGYNKMQRLNKMEGLYPAIKSAFM